MNREERLIVAWLRSQRGNPQAAGEAQRMVRFYAEIFAEGIERGEHRPPSYQPTWENPDGPTAA
jgi:hypothetical protein